MRRYLLAKMLIIFVSLMFTQSSFGGVAEDKVVAKCAASSVDPATFFSCTFGKLTMTEISKCFTGTCLGPNNTAVKFNNWFNKNIIGGCSFHAVNSGGTLEILNRTSFALPIHLSSANSGGSFTISPNQARFFDHIFADCGQPSPSVHVSIKGTKISNVVATGSILSATYDGSQVKLFDVTPRVLLVQNKCNEGVRLALHYYTVSDQWKSAGWWRVPPGQSTKLIERSVLMPSSPSLYIYGTSDSTQYHWFGNYNYHLNGSILPMKLTTTKVAGNTEILTLTCK